jgi:hypothetical protein
MTADITVVRLAVRGVIAVVGHQAFGLGSYPLAM